VNGTYWLENMLMTLIYSAKNGVKEGTGIWLLAVSSRRDTIKSKCYEN
jgi:hypothetical protein